MNTLETTGSNQSGMRAHNERLVLSILRRLGPLPKVEIARKTGLSAQTVSVIMRALETDGLLEKGEKLRGKIGQPSVPLRLVPHGAYFLGLKVGRRSAELTLVNFVGKEIAMISEAYAYPTPEATVAFVQTAYDTICAGLSPAQKERIAGMGIAQPFFLWEWANVIGVDVDAMAGWRGFDLCQHVSELFEFPVYLGNDASCACGAELVFGTTETPPDFLYIYIGYFVGGGVVLNGNLYTGRSGNAGAIGPFPVLGQSGDHRQLVDVASLIGLERRLDPEQRAKQFVAGPSDSWSVDPAIIDDWLAEAIPPLCQTILGAVSVIDFPAVLLDGNMPTTLRARMVSDIAAGLQDMNQSGLTMPRVLEGSLGTRARPLGAASLPLAKRFMLEA